MDEVTWAIGRLGDKRSPGSDGIPALILKSLVRWIFWEIMVNRGLESGFFPVCWKEVWVVFLPKGGPAGWPAEYHPICLLNTTAKVVKRMLAVIDELKAGMDIHLNQYGFCKGKSTTQVISRVINWAAREREGTWRTRNMRMMILLDVKNAFGSILWGSIMVSLREKGITN